MGLTTPSLLLGVLSKQRYPMRSWYEFRTHLLFLRIFYQHFANLEDKFASLKLVVNNVGS